MAGSGPADHLCDPPSRELCNPLMRRPLRPYTKIVDATVGSTSDFIGASWYPSPQQVGPSESHEAAAELFANHPHFMIFPGQSVEVMECLPIPKM